MSVNVRPRRSSSPPTIQPRSLNPRYDRLDADARREAVSKGYSLARKHHPPGGIDLTRAEWRLLFMVILVAAGVRLFRIARPDSVVCVMFLNLGCPLLTGLGIS